ncbi:MAG: fibronectin type III domain-containing protein [Nitrospiraceae bacterium]|nr:fibronectin type III domain-containing protein [Nitrospiraceae bacterium]
MFNFLFDRKHEVAGTSINKTLSLLMEQSLTASTKQRFFPRISALKTPRIPSRLASVTTVLLLTIIPLLTGCAPEEQTGSGSTATLAGATASLEWQPVQDPSVIAYFVHYGRQSPGQPGSCTYESSMYVDSPSATITNLDPNTLYYFSVSAYNGLESPCSEEVSTVTASPATSPGQPAPLA